LWNTSQKTLHNFAGNLTIPLLQMKVYVGSPGNDSQGGKRMEAVLEAERRTSASTEEDKREDTR
jgi:hypothetical protein